MADARGAVCPCENLKNPKSLYELCLTNLVNYLHKAKCEKKVLRTLPDVILMDVYLKMLHEKQLCILGSELSELSVFERLLRFSGHHIDLLKCFEAVIEHGSRPFTELATGYVARCDNTELGNKDSLIHLGLKLGGFLNEAGWYADAERVLIRCRDLCQAQPQTTYYKRLTLECCHRLLNTQSAYCCFPAAAETYSLALQLMGVSKRAASEARLAHADARFAGTQTDGDHPPNNGDHPPNNGDHPLTNGDHPPNNGDHPPNNGDHPPINGEHPPANGDHPPTNGDHPPTNGDHPPANEDHPPTNDSHTRLSSDVSAAGGGDACAGAAVWGGAALMARLCKEFSSLFFVRCDYTLAYAWAMQAFSFLTPNTPPKITIDVLRACAKACVVKRRFGAAGAAARHAVGCAKRAFGVAHPRYAAALLDYGFYLLNIDSIVHSVAVYEEALEVVRGVFGRSSLHVATAQEDLAYALYVLEYSSGRFYQARAHAERAISIIENLVPSDHLLLASAKRVKALILEEIALDMPAGQMAFDMLSNKPSLLEESEALHKAALVLSMRAFGEKNVQTAKHYGNLGRLYQSMQKFHDAEKMHLKAIAIKEELLGAEDYEVGLSIGHLASLYNYHMNMHTAAAKLYLRSIAISLKLFGERYSGLEYDYRGLVHVFTQLKEHDTASYYTRLLHHWSELREQSRAEPQPSLGQEETIPLSELKAKFFGTND